MKECLVAISLAVPLGAPSAVNAQSNNGALSESALESAQAVTPNEKDPCLRKALLSER